MAVNVRQLELNLEVVLEAAAEVPEKVNLLSLWSQVEGVLKSHNPSVITSTGVRSISICCSS